jgi:iron uptake system component EfeO
LIDARVERDSPEKIAMTMKMTTTLLLTSLALAGCGGSHPPKTDADYRREVVSGMHDSLLGGIDELHRAAIELQSAAPRTTGRGWDAQADAQSIAAMKSAWVNARTAYEHIEGAIAPLFPELDGSLDARYDDFLTQLNGKGDANAFDDQGVTGLHAIERILYVDTTPARVVDFEKTIPGYAPAAFPATAEEASDFKDKLCAKLIADAELLESQWTPQKIDIGGAFQGLIALMNEQREKVSKASTFEEESRYSQRTMADIRANLDGTTAIYALFEPWLATKTTASGAAKDGPATDAKIRSGLSSLADAYAGVQGDAIPEPPKTWSAEHPAATDMQSPFGKLYGSVQSAVDPSADGSIVSAMNEAAVVLGFPEFAEAP